MVKAASSAFSIRMGIHGIDNTDLNPQGEHKHVYNLIIECRGLTATKQRK